MKIEVNVRILHRVILDGKPVRCAVSRFSGKISSPGKLDVGESFDLLASGLPEKRLVVNARGNNVFPSTNLKPAYFEQVVTCEDVSDDMPVLIQSQVATTMIKRLEYVRDHIAPALAAYDISYLGVLPIESES